MTSLAVDTANAVKGVSTPTSADLQHWGTFDFGLNSFESETSFREVHISSIHRIFNLKWLFCGILSTLGVFIMTNYHLNLHIIATPLWVFGYSYGAFICSIILTKRKNKPMDKQDQKCTIEMEQSPSEKFFTEDILDFMH